MKKYFETAPNFDGLKERIIVLKDGEDKKTLFAVIALVTAVLIAVTVGVVYLLKTRMDDEYEEEVSHLLNTSEFSDRLTDGVCHIVYSSDIYKAFFSVPVFGFPIA